MKRRRGNTTDWNVRIPAHTVCQGPEPDVVMPATPHLQAFSAGGFQGRGSCPDYCHHTLTSEIFAFWERLSGLSSARWDPQWVLVYLTSLSVGLEGGEWGSARPQESSGLASRCGSLTLLSPFIPPEPSVYPFPVCQVPSLFKFETRVFLTLQATLHSLCCSGLTLHLWLHSRPVCPLQGTAEVRADLGTACLSCLSSSSGPAGGSRLQKIHLLSNAGGLL